MGKLDTFDDAGASMRILKVLKKQPQGGAATMELYMVMREGYGVGRTAVDSSLEALVELGLVEVWRQERVRANVLTEKGFAVAGVVEGLEAALEG